MNPLCQRRFEPRRKNQLYCTANCRIEAKKLRFRRILVTPEEHERIKRYRRRSRASLPLVPPASLGHTSLNPDGTSWSDVMRFLVSRKPLTILRLAEAQG
jgi:hypothetical protein